MNRPDTHVSEELAAENNFTKKIQDRKPVPLFSEIRDSLPSPEWEGHEDVLRCYWKTWELAFSNLRRPVAGTRFVSPFIDTAFNGNLFLWDSVFILMFGKYGRQAFDFQQTMDNFYSHQHSDGYICREIRESDSGEVFERFDPSSTGPNLFAWSEWEYYLISRDKKRLEEVFPPLLAYNRWFRKHRTWRDGSYWSSGWGCGMDNQPRLSRGYHCEFDHGHMVWSDTTLQQILSDRLLIQIAGILDRETIVRREIEEQKALRLYAEEKLWDREKSFFFDIHRDGDRGDVKSIGAFWALLAEAVPEKGLSSFIDHLESKKEFNRPHRVPTLSADHKDYEEDGGYWRGGVWAPTNYMVLRGLSHTGRDELAHRIGANHLENVVSVFNETGTLWENYAPENSVPGEPSRPDFVGWTGLSSIAVLFEYLFGIRPQPDQTLLWDIRLLERHGIRKYPFGKGTIDLFCKERSSRDEEPDVEIRSTAPLKIRIKWESGEKQIERK